MAQYIILQFYPIDAATWVANMSSFRRSMLGITASGAIQRAVHRHRFAPTALTFQISFPPRRCVEALSKNVRRRRKH